MGFFKDMGNWLGFEERATDSSLTMLKSTKPQVTETVSKPVQKKPIQYDLQKTNILLTEPRNIEDDYKEILGLLRDKQVVLINTKYLDLPSSKKLLDTASGVVYAINGYMTKVGNGIFLCAPANVNVVSNEQEEVLFNDEPAATPEIPAYAAATGTYDAQPVQSAQPKPFVSLADYNPAPAAQPAYF